MNPAPANDRASKIRSVIRVSSGNFLEMYDFMIFGYYAAIIAQVFFPHGSAAGALMLSLMTFGAGFLMRPLGAVVLGAYIDSKGRRAGLLLTLALMSVGTLSIACLPGYEKLGWFAPLFVLLGRLLQGFSAGVELGGVSVYLSEIATPGKKGFYTSWQSASQQVAVIFAALIGILLTSRLSQEQMTSFGWRVPMLIGCGIIPFLFVIRRSLKETPAFLAQKKSPRPKEILALLVANWPIVLTGALLVTMSNVSFYLITAYTPTFGAQVLHLAERDNLIVTLAVGASNLFWLPIMGTVSDRTGRRPLLIACTLIALVTAYPAMAWLSSAPSFTRLLTVELWFSLIYATYNAAMIVFLTEIMPAAVRTTGFSLAYSLSSAIFGGFTPAICTWLIFRTGNSAMPGVWMSFAAILGLGAVLASRTLQPPADAAVAELAPVHPSGSTDVRAAG